MKTIIERLLARLLPSVRSNERRHRDNRGLTAVEMLMAFALVGVAGGILFMALRDADIGAEEKQAKSNAIMLYQSVNAYRMIEKKNISGTAAKPMTSARANAIFAEIGGTRSDGTTIIEANYVLPANAKFPASWGESAVGVFDPIP